MAREAKLIITSENKAEPGIKDAIRSVVGLDQAVQKVGDTIKGAFTVLAVFEGLKKLTQFSIESVKAFGEMERSMLQLKTAIGGNEASFGRLTGLIDDMAGKTLSSKDEIEGLVAELASLGRSDEEIEKITQAAVNLSNVTGKSLNDAFTQLNATYAGTGGKLEKLIPELGDLTEEQLKAGAATDLINAKFQKLSDTMATGVSQRLSNLGKGFDDLRENLGSRLLVVFDPIVAGIDRIVKKWNDALNAQQEYADALQNNSGLAEAIERQRSAQDAVSKAFSVYATAQTQAASIGQSIKPEIQEAFNALNVELRNANTALQLARQAANGSTRGPAGVPIGDTGSGMVPSDQKTTYPNIGEVQPGAGFTFSGDKLLAGIVEYAARSKEEFSIPQTEGGLMLSEKSTVPLSIFEELALSLGKATIEDPQRYAPTPGSAQEYKGAYIEEESESIFEPLKTMFDKITGSLSGMNIVATALNKVFQGAMNILGPAIDQILTPIFNVLTGFGEQIGNALLPLFEFLGETILPVVMVGLKGLAVALEVLMSPVRFLADLFKWLGQAIQDFFYNLTNPVWEKDRKTAAFSSDAFSGLDERIAKIWANDYAAGTPTGAVTYSGAAMGAIGSGGATYTGGQSIVFNFYNQGNVVGSGGMQELATTIGGLIKQQARYA